jgi:hypothetical protein
VALLQLRHGLAQVVHRNVHRHIGRRPQHRKQPRGLGAAARAQIDQHRARGHPLRHGLAMGREDGRLGARGVVLGQFGDGVEQARTQGVVEKLGRRARRIGQQAGHQLGAQRGVVGSGGSARTAGRGKWDMGSPAVRSRGCAL